MNCQAILKLVIANRQVESGFLQLNVNRIIMNIISKLQDWYFSKCDEDWEHEFGVKIDTLDNPGCGTDRHPLPYKIKIGRPASCHATVSFA